MDICQFHWLNFTHAHYYLWIKCHQTLVRKALIQHLETRKLLWKCTLLMLLLTLAVMRVTFVCDLVRS